MPVPVAFDVVSTTGLESSPVAEALAGLRAHEARYFHNKHGVPFAVSPAADAPESLAWVTGILADERDIIIASPPLEVAEVDVPGVRWTYVFYESGLAVNVLWSLENPSDRAVGFKLSDGMDVPAELVERFKFARMKSALAGTIRGTYFKIKGEH